MPRFTFCGRPSGVGSVSVEVSVTNRSYRPGSGGPPGPTPSRGPSGRPAPPTRDWLAPVLEVARLVDDDFLAGVGRAQAAVGAAVDVVDLRRRMGRANGSRMRIPDRWPASHATRLGRRARRWREFGAWPARRPRARRARGRAAPWPLSYSGRPRAGPRDAPGTPARVRRRGAPSAANSGPNTANGRPAAARESAAAD